jgi:hypothetical protein
MCPKVQQDTPSRRRSQRGKPGRLEGGTTVFGDATGGGWAMPGHSDEELRAPAIRAKVPATRPVDSTPDAPSGAAAVGALQRLAGNRAVAGCCEVPGPSRQRDRDPCSATTARVPPRRPSVSAGRDRVPTAAIGCTWIRPSRPRSGPSRPCAPNSRRIRSRNNWSISPCRNCRPSCSPRRLRPARRVDRPHRRLRPGPRPAPG